MQVNIKLTLSPYQIDGTVITEKIKTWNIPVSNCVLPVNHNISVMGY